MLKNILFSISIPILNIYTIELNKIFYIDLRITTTCVNYYLVVVTMTAVNVKSPNVEKYQKKDFYYH